MVFNSIEIQIDPWHEPVKNKIKNNTNTYVKYIGFLDPLPQGNGNYNIMISNTRDNFDV